MRSVTHVIFDRAETNIIGRAWTHIRIAYPDLDSLPALGDRERRHRDIIDARAVAALLSPGQSATHVLLTRAAVALTLLREQCMVQSTVEYWTGVLHTTGPQPPTVTAVVPERLLANRHGVAGLVAAGTDICAVLAETRTTQAEDARRALVLVNNALTFASHPDEEDA